MSIIPHDGKSLDVTVLCDRLLNGERLKDLSDELGIPQFKLRGFVQSAGLKYSVTAMRYVRAYEGEHKDSQEVVRRLLEGQASRKVMRELGISNETLTGIAHRNGLRYVRDGQAGRWVNTQEDTAMKDQPWDDNPTAYADLVTPEREKPRMQYIPRLPLKEDDQAAYETSEILRDSDPQPTLAPDESPVMAAYRLLQEAAERFDQMDKDTKQARLEAQEARRFGQEHYERTGVLERELTEAKQLLTAEGNRARSLQSQNERLNEQLKIEISKSARLQEKVEGGLLQQGMAALQSRLRQG